MKRAVPLLLLALTIPACGENGGGTADALAEDTRAVLATVAAVVEERLTLFRDRAVALEAAATAYAAAPEDTALQSAARTAWSDAMEPWQELEVLQIGPAGEPLDGDVGSLGGQDLRNEIYSWPSTNLCRIDQEVVEGAYADGDAFLAAELTNVRGLDAMEYLLFAPTTENDCTPLDPINAEGTWAALGDAEVTARRAAFAATLAAGVRAQADALHAAWFGADGAGGAFADELRTAGDTSTLFLTAQLALEDLSSQLLYLDVAVKDMKVGDPSGLRMSAMRACEAPPCPELLESPFAERSLEHIRANVAGFAAVFRGTETQPGLSELLVAAGADATAAQMTTDLAASEAAFAAASSPLADALDTQPVADGFAALDRLMDGFRTGYTSALDVRLPSGPVGDND
jgi:predicted lipoprotein